MAEAGGGGAAGQECAWERAQAARLPEEAGRDAEDSAGTFGRRRTGAHPALGPFRLSSVPDRETEAHSRPGTSGGANEEPNPGLRRVKAPTRPRVSTTRRAQGA